MAEMADALFERLESALEEWASDVSSTHEHLAGRVASVRERAAQAPERDEHIEQVSAVLQANRAHFSTLQDAIRQCTDAAKDALTRSDGLDNAFATLEEEVRELKHLATQSITSHESIDHGSPDAAAEAIGEFRAILEAHSERITRIEQQLAQALPTGPTQQQWSRLERDFARLRGEVHRMRGAGPSASDSPAAAFGGPFDEVAAPDVIDLDLTGFDTAGRRKRMGDMLVEAGVLSQVQLERALNIQQEQPQRRLGSILIELGYTESDVIAQVLACQAKVPFVRLDKDEPDPAAVRLVSERLASHHVCIPLRVEDDRVILAMANPMDLIAIQDIEHATSRGVDPVATSSDGIMQAIKAYYGVESR